MTGEGAMAAEGDPAAAWAAYLAELQQSDPAEYELLLQDLAGFVESNPEREIVVKAPGEGEGAGDQAPQEPTRLPGGKVIGKQGKVEDADDEGEKVDPAPGFVLKTVDDKGRKIFVNVCQSPLIQKTSVKKQLAEDGTEQEGISIPLSLGPPRPDKDNAGKPCVVYDIVVHPEVIDKAKEDKTGASRSFLCELALQYVEQKYSCKVDYKYKLPKTRYKGDINNIPFQMIRKRRAPVIEEVSADKPNSVVVKGGQRKQGTASGGGTAPRKPKAVALAYTLKRYNGDDWESAEPCQAVLCDPEVDPGDQQGGGLLFEARLGAAESAPDLVDQVRIDVSEQFLAVRVDGHYLPLELFLPLEVDTKSAEVTFDEESLLLRVRLAATPPLQAVWRTSTSPDPGSRQWMLASALAVENGATPARSLGPEGPSPIEEEPQDTRRPAEEEDDVLPEDRFHLADMLSQHIKDERERERQEKVKRHEEEEAKKKQEEERQRVAERQKQIQEILQQAEQELSTNVATTDLPRAKKQLALDTEQLSTPAPIDDEDDEDMLL